MLSLKSFRLIFALVFMSSLLMIGTGVAAQTPTPTPRPTPTQRDATKPPGQEQNPSIPPGAQPATTNPQTPPGTQQISPVAPPGTNPARTTLSTSAPLTL